MQVLDDSTDITGDLADDGVRRLRLRGIRSDVLRREAPDGFKAGALNMGLARATGDVVAIFDADFVPPPDFLNRIMPMLEAEEVACVQTRWSYLNEASSWLTRSLAIALDAHFLIEQEVRSHYGLLLSFNATACVWKRTSLAGLGGWPTETVTEDLDLSIRALTTGRRIRYVDTPAVPCEVPTEVLGFANQQARWARGGAQNLRLHASTLVRARMGDWDRVDTAFHLAHYGFQVLVVLLFLSTVGAIVLGRALDPAYAMAFAVVATLGPFLLLVDGQRRSHPKTFVWRMWRLLPLTMVGVGISLRVAGAFLSGLVSRRFTFDRTPKYGIVGRDSNWRASAYVPRADVFTAFEGLCALLALTAAALGFVQERFGLAASLAAFGVSYAWVFLHSVFERRGRGDRI